MDKDSTTPADEPTLFAGTAWFDPIEAGLRERIRGFLEELIEQELTEALGRGRYERGGAPARPAGAAAGRLLRAGGDRRAAGPAAG
jgi:putative transposase